VWNPFKTLSERDSARLRQLERVCHNLSADIDECLTAVDRIDARLRTRAARAARSRDVSADSVVGDEPDFVMPTRVGAEESDSSMTQRPLVEGVSSKERLRALARQRGLLPQLPGSRAG
jgi:hypothetical protein